MNAQPDQVLITDVLLRDGLQSCAAFVPTASKIDLLHRLHAAGLARMEVTSFVSPRTVPQMADASEVLRAANDLVGLQASVLVPNRRGLHRALDGGAREVAMVLAATDTMNRRNVRMSLAQAAGEAQAVVREAVAAGARTRAYLAVAWVCPFEGDVTTDVASRLVDLLVQAGADEIVLADTIGAAGPRDVALLLTHLLRELPADRIGLHLHDTRGLGVANAWEALRHGVRRFDTSAGGVGGCPFAPGATGNLATEDLVSLADRCGLACSVDPDKLLDAIDLAGRLLADVPGGRSLAWWRLQHARQHNPAMDRILARTTHEGDMT